MKLVIADATPLHYLILIGQVEVLAELFTSIVVPHAVIQELLHAHTPSSVASWARRPPAWVVIRRAASIEDLDLGPGETEAIALAVEVPDSLLLMDDRRGRRAAARLGLAFTGTIAVLSLADKAGLLVLEEACERLKATNVYLDPVLVNDALAEARKRRGA